MPLRVPERGISRDIVQTIVAAVIRPSDHGGVLQRARAVILKYAICTAWDEAHHIFTPFRIICADCVFLYVL